MKKRRYNHETNTGMFADISFLLLIFFMVVTTFNKAYQVEMALPPVKEDAPPARLNKSRLLSIHLNDLSQTLIGDKLYQAGEGYSLTEELSRICSQQRKGVVSIHMHPDTPYDQYIQLLTTLKRDKTLLQRDMAQELFHKPLSELSPDERSTIIQRTKYSVTEKEVHYDQD